MPGNLARDEPVVAGMLRLLPVAVTACSTLDEDVSVYVQDVAIELDRAQPAAPAGIYVVLALHPGPRADHVVDVVRVTLQTPDASPRQVASLAMSLPSGFDPHVHPEEWRTVRLTHAIVNEALIPHCGERDELVVEVGYPDESDGWALTPPATVAIACR